MARKKYTPFAIDTNDQIFVEVRAVMSPLIPFIDGLPITFFGKSKKAYLRLDEAEEWVRREREHHHKEKYDKILELFARVRREKAAGTLIEQ